MAGEFIVAGALIVWFMFWRLLIWISIPIGLYGIVKAEDIVGRVFGLIWLVYGLFSLAAVFSRNVSAIAVSFYGGIPLLIITIILAAIKGRMESQTS